MTSSGLPGSKATINAGGRSEGPIKVLVLIPTLEIGGAEMDLLRNLPNLNRHRLDPVVCTLVGEPSALSSELTAAGIEVTALNLKAPVGKGFYHRLCAAVEHSCRSMVDRLPRFAFTRFLAAGEKYIRIARCLACYLDEANVDVVHCILPNAYLIAVLANGLTQRHRPLAMSRVSQNWYHQDIKLFGLIERWWLHRRIEMAIANSQAVLQELRAEGIPDQKLVLVHNGIDAVKFAGQMLDLEAARHQLDVPQDALVLTCVGSLRPRKGHADLLSALHLAKDQLPPNWLLLAAGRDIDGNLAKLQQVAEELRISQHVRLLDERRDIPVILSAADIHISPSWYESFPNNILEAMCAGLPVAATAVGGVPEQIVDGLTGILIPPRDPQALADAIVALSGDLDRRKAMGRAGRERVELKFPITRSVSALEQAYGQLSAPARCHARSKTAPAVRH